MLYSVYMYREGKRNSHSYLHRITKDYESAKLEADKEKKRRNNKYEYEIIESDNDRHINILIYSTMYN